MTVVWVHSWSNERWFVRGDTFCCTLHWVNDERGVMSRCDVVMIVVRVHGWSNERWCVRGDPFCLTERGCYCTNSKSEKTLSALGLEPRVFRFRFSAICDALTHMATEDRFFRECILCENNHKFVYFWRKSQWLMGKVDKSFLEVLTFCGKLQMVLHSNSQSVNKLSWKKIDLSMRAK